MDPVALETLVITNSSYHGYGMSGDIDTCGHNKEELPVCRWGVGEGRICGRGQALISNQDLPAQWIFEEGIDRCVVRCP